jgi:5-methylcytosine-specific restriction endonuclease McrA
VKVFVLNADKTPLMPCWPIRAYQLLHERRAAVYRVKPFTIILKTQIENPTLQDTELRLDPGSKTTGIAIVSNDSVVFAAELEHRGQAVHLKIESRAALRRGRRNRRTRYRKPRFLNRTRKDGWLPPSIKSRVDNVESWTNKFRRFAPLTSIAVEQVRFDMQLLQNPNIAGVEYQQGELAGYEVREYLLAKFDRECIYCDIRDVALEIEHLTPKSRGGSNRISNLGIACHPCNQKKDKMTVAEFVQDDARRTKIERQRKAPLKDAAAINTTRFAIVKMLKTFGIPVTCWTGGRTKYNRRKQAYRKAHWIDAACVGERGAHVSLREDEPFLQIKAMGRGNRQVCRTNRYGFPNTKPKGAKRRHGFSTGDIVRATISKGKMIGTFTSRISAISAARFDLKTAAGIIGTTAKRLVLLQRSDGYQYA